MTPEQFLLVILTLIVAMSVRVLFGFGDALVAMPLLAMIIGLRTAAPAMALLSGTVAFTMLWTTWRSVHVESAWRLVVSAICGVPFGALLLRGAYEGAMTGVLGCVVLVFAAYNLWTPKKIVLNTDRWAFVFGFCAGILGGAYNTNGPPLVIYGTFRHWTPQQFRATLQGVFIFSGPAVLISHGASGLWTRQVFILYAAALPVVLAVVLLGGRFAARFDAERFRSYVYVLLLVLGSSLIFQTVAR